MKTRTLFFILVLFNINIFGCYRDTHTVEKAGKIVVFTPPTYTHSVTVKIEGTFTCPTNLKVGIDHSEKMFSYLTLIGKVDTLIRRDWYENDLYVLLEPESCVEELELFKVKFHSNTLGLN